MSWEQAPNVPGTEGGPEALPHPQTWISHSVPVWCWVLGTGRGVVSQAMGHRGGGCIGHLSLGGGDKNAGEVSLLFPLVSAGLVDRILVSARTGMRQQDPRLRTWA